MFLYMYEIGHFHQLEITLHTSASLVICSLNFCKISFDICKRNSGVSIYKMAVFGLTHCISEDESK